MKTSLSTILLALLLAFGLISLTSNNLSSAPQPQQGLGGAFPYNAFASGTFDGTTVVQAPPDKRIYITEVGIGGTFDMNTYLYLNDAATGVNTCISRGLGTQNTIDVYGNGQARATSAVQLKFSVAPALILEPGNSLTLDKSLTGYWSGYMTR